MEEVLKTIAAAFRAEAVNCGTPTQVAFLAVADRLELESQKVVQPKTPVDWSSMTTKYNKPEESKPVAPEKGKTA